jgi:tRNA-specific 2-thiouridylase
VTADKPESMEVCFVPTGDVRDALRARAGWQPVAGPVVDEAGSVVGEHGGAAAYTVGQRRGLGVALGEPRYVSRVDPRTNTIVLARRADLETRRIDVEDATFVAGRPPSDAFQAEVQVRHRATPVRASVRRAGPGEPDRGGRWTVETDAPVWAAAPGQACVLFDGDVVIGGGRIARPDG